MPGSVQIARAELRALRRRRRGTQPAEREPRLDRGARRILPANARLSSGTSMLSRSAPYSARVRPRPKGLGSKPGVDTSAMTSPLFGSMATTAPRRPMSPCSATSCVGRSMVVMRSRPAAGLISCRSGLERALALRPSGPRHSPGSGASRPCRAAPLRTTPRCRACRSARCRRTC